MKVLQINCVYGYASTGVITRDIQQYSLDNGIDAYVAFQKGHGIGNERTYEIGSTLDHKIHAFFCRIAGKQAYFSHCATHRLLHYMDQLKPDIVHLHNLHNNYINLNMVLRYLAEKDIRTVITLHDCWYFTGGCFHYSAINCNQWQLSCGKCPKQKEDTPAIFYDASETILSDRIKYFSVIKNLTFVGVSKWIVQELKKSHIGKKCKIEQIYNGFDLNVFKPTDSDFRKRLGFIDKFILLGPASKWLQPINKPTLDFFIENMPSHYVLLLFGCNEQFYKFPPNVKIYGFTNNRRELAQLYSMADVMVNCSREDTLSSLNLECQACGTPVVTYDATGNAETVDNNCSFSVKTGDYCKLLSSVMYIEKFRKVDLSNKCQKWVKTNFDREINYIQYVKLYKSIK